LLISRNKIEPSPFGLPLRSNLFFYSHLQLVRDRVCSFTGSKEAIHPVVFRYTFAGANERASERTLVIPVDRFFVEDAQPRIKLREPRREESRGGCHRSRSSCNRAERRWSPPLVRRTPLAYATNRSTSCFTTAREIKLRGVCNAVAPAASHQRVFPKRP
jgi:hypothetical protein